MYNIEEILLSINNELFNNGEDDLFPQNFSLLDSQNSIYEPQISNTDKSLKIFTIANKSTAVFKNEDKKNHQINENASLKKEINKNDESFYKLYQFEDIQAYLFNFEYILSRFNKTYYIRKAENKLSDEKKIKEEITENYNEKKNPHLVEKPKRGRKCDDDQKRKLHDKNSADNCIKYIKSKLLKCLVEFMNKIMGKTDKNKLYNLNSKYANELKKTTNLDIFEMSLKDLLSKEITPKSINSNKNLNKNFNKILIQKIENKKEKVEDYNTTMFALNMKFGDWIQFFTQKKYLNEIENFDDKIDIYRIESILSEVFSGLLEKMNKKTNDEYFSLLIFYLYNYQRWFVKKNGRNKKNNIIIRFKKS